MKSLLLLLVVLYVVSASCLLSNRPIGSYRLWHRESSINSHESVRLTFLMKTQNQELLNSILTAVSDPDSPYYGKYLTLDQVTALTASTQSLDATKQFLLHVAQAKKIDIARSGDFITATLQAGVVENLFHTKLHTFTSSHNRDRKIIRSESYRLPSELTEHVVGVTNINYFPNIHKRSSFKKFPKQSMQHVRKLHQPSPPPADTVTPQLLAQVYNIPSLKVASPKATQAVFETLGQDVDWSDMVGFWESMNIPIPTQNYTVIGPNTPNGCADNPQNCDESLLDIQWIMSIAQDSPTTWYSIDSNDPQPFVDFLKDLSNDPNAPLVNSISYGGQEDQEDPSIAAQFNTIIQKLGVRGITILVASGDQGVTGTTVNGTFECGFFPNYPVSSPYVVAVGATQGPESGQAEIGCSANTGALITSGGGFSGFWTQPSYQTNVVKAYLSNSAVPPASVGYNAGGRAYPDIAVLGHNYNEYDGGSLDQGDGTSASTPVFAAMLTLINGLRMQAGKSAVGFVNPALYKIAETTPDAFHDITSGNNNCGEQGDGCCQYGFPAVKGWDGMTGLGSVNFKNLAEAFLALP